jgi:hypothetical protein
MVLRRSWPVKKLQSLRSVNHWIGPSDRRWLLESCATASAARQRAPTTRPTLDWTATSIIWSPFRADPRRARQPDDVTRSKEDALVTTAPANKSEGAEPFECWCCGVVSREAELIHLGNHPEVSVCLSCAHFLHQQARSREDALHPSPAARLRDRLRSARGRHAATLASQADHRPTVALVGTAPALIRRVVAVSVWSRCGASRVILNRLPLTSLLANGP